MKTLNGVTSRTHLPHGLFDNQQTHYDSVRSETFFRNTKFYSHQFLVKSSIPSQIVEGRRPRQEAGELLRRGAQLHQEQQDVRLQVSDLLI